MMGAGEPWICIRGGNAGGRTQERERQCVPQYSDILSINASALLGNSMNQAIEDCVSGTHRPRSSHTQIEHGSAVSLNS